MGKLHEGLFGGFTGRIGNVVGVTWRGQHYIRTAPGHVRNPNTQQQQTQRGRFTVAVSFVRKILDYVRIGFRDDSQTCSAYNAAQSCIMKYAIEGKGEECSLNYSKVFVARGMLLGAEQASASRTEAGITFEWTDNSGEVDALSTDVAMPLAYNIVREQGVWDTTQALRSDKVTHLDLPTAWVDDPCAVYLAFRSETGESVANSVYLGILG